MSTSSSPFGHNIKLKVGYVLKTLPLTRDDDLELLRQAWLIEYPNISHLINDICNNMKLNHLTFPDSLTRARRSLQEKHESLRGELWGKRHQQAEDIRQMYFSFVEEI